MASKSRVRPASAPAGEHLTRPRSARAAVLTMFFVNGAALATWVPLIPAVQQKLGLSASELGIALLGVAVGAVVSTPSTGWLVGRAGGRRVVTLAAILGCVILPLLPVVPALPLLTLTLVVFGAALATMDVAMNIQGAAVEAFYQRPLMSTFHAFYSIGGFAGALVSGALAAVGVAPFDRALWPAVLLGAAAIVAHQWLPSAEPHTASRRSRVRIRITRQSWPLAALGLMAFCSLLAEGASGDWSALYLHKSLGADAAFAATAFAAFSVAMAVGRLSGDWLTSRLGAGLLLRVGGALAAAGLTATLLLGRPATRHRRIRFGWSRSCQRGPNSLQRRRSFEFPRATCGDCRGRVRRLRRSTRRPTVDWLHRASVHPHPCPHRSRCVLRADRTPGADGPPRRLMREAFRRAERNAQDDGRAQWD